MVELDNEKDKRKYTEIYISKNDDFRKIEIWYTRIGQIRCLFANFLRLRFTTFVAKYFPETLVKYSRKYSLYKTYFQNTLEYYN